MAIDKQKVKGSWKRKPCKADMDEDRPRKRAQMFTTRLQKRSLRLEIARRAVLDLPELLENILRHLSMKDLLLSQRVSRNFQGTIGGSPTLQRMLFFAPTLSASDLADMLWRNGGLEDAGDLTREEERALEKDNERRRGYYRDAYYNPLLLCKPCRSDTIPMFHCTQELELRSRFPNSYTFASWRRMFLT